MHPYESISLLSAGLVVAAYLIATHLWMLLKPEESMKQVKGLARNHKAGAVVLVVAMAWFWLLVAPKGLGVLSALTMELGEFNNFKKIIRVVVPLACVGMIIYVKEFLFVRALGTFMLMAAAPLLAAAFLKEPTSRLLIPIFVYVMIIKGLFFVGMPYLYRDWVSRAAATAERWKIFAMAGLVYGVAVLGCALLFWRGQ